MDELSRLSLERKLEYDGKCERGICDQKVQRFRNSEIQRFRGFDYAVFLWLAKKLFVIASSLSILSPGCCAVICVAGKCVQANDPRAILKKPLLWQLCGARPVFGAGYGRA